MPFEYPDHPNKNRVDPTRDMSLENPFADSEVAADEAELPDNPYAATACGDPVPYRPAEFQTTYRHRGGLVLLLGLGGFGGSVLSASGLLCSIFVRHAFAASLGPLSATLLFVSLSLCWSAWLMGRHDLSAMQAGAMVADGMRSTRIGCLAGMWGALGGASALVLLACLMAISLLTDF